MIKKIIKCCSLLGTFALHGECTFKDVAVINRLNPYELYTSIINKHFEIFKHPIESQNFKEKLESFFDFIACVNNNLSVPSSEQNNKILLKNLTVISGAIKNIVDKGIIKNNRVLLGYKENLLALHRDSLLKAIENINEPEEWKKGVPSRANEILKDYDLFFKNFAATKKQYISYNKLPSTSSLPQDRIINFLKNQSFIGQNRDEKITQQKIVQFADTLERLIYRFKEDIKKKFLGIGTGALQNKIDMSEEILAAIIGTYPDTITSIMDLKLPQSKSKFWLVINAESNCLYTIIQYLLEK